MNGKKNVPRKLSKDRSAPSKIKSVEKDTPFFLLVLLPLVITALAFSPMLFNGFTNWDDEVYVLNNTLLHGPDWKGIFTQPVSSNYHPLTILSLAFNYQFSALAPYSYLLVNLLLHLANTVLVFYFIYDISGKKTWAASLTALVFGIHPMHVESVAWISERKDVLYAFFFICSLIQYWKFIGTEKKFHYGMSFLFFVLSLLSKPAAIILPMVLLLLDYWKGRPLNKSSFGNSHRWRNLLFEKVPFFALSFSFAVITLRMQSDFGLASFEIFPAYTHFFFACYGVMIYLMRFIFPYPLSAFHPYPSPDDLGFDVFVSPFFIIGLGFFILYVRKNKLIVFGILFFIVNLLLVLQVIALGSTIVSERYTYVPYIGLAFVFAMFIDKLANRYGKTLRWVGLTGVALIFGVITFGRTQVWKDSGTLWSDVIKQLPLAPSPRSNRAHYVFKKAATLTDASKKNRLYLQIVEDCNVALATANNIVLSPEQEKSAGGNTLLKFDLYSMRGASYDYLNQPEQAKDDYTKCISLFPDNEFAYVNRGAILFEENRYKEALDDFNKAISLSHGGNYYLNRSYCYFKLGDLIKAKEDMHAAIRLGEVVSAEYQNELK